MLTNGRTFTSFNFAAYLVTTIRTRFFGDRANANMCLFTTAIKALRSGSVTFNLFQFINQLQKLLSSLSVIESGLSTTVHKQNSKSSSISITLTLLKLATISYNSNNLLFGVKFANLIRIMLSQILGTTLADEISYFSQKESFFFNQNRIIIITHPFV